MPRKAKDKEEIAKKVPAKTKKETSKTVKSSTTKKKATTKKVSKAKKTVLKSTTKKKTTTRKKKEFLAEYYDLPFNYNKTVVKLLAQTPETLFVYWEISDDDKKRFAKDYGDNFFETTTPILKVHNKTMNYTFEIEINDFANCWYFHINDSKCDYQVELDRKLKSNEYVYITSSNEIESPNDHILFKQNLSTVQFKNVKNNKIRNVNVSINKDYKNVYDIKELYELLYSEEQLNDLEDLSNPSSGNPTSTFK